MTQLIGQVINSLESVISNIIQKSQDRFLVAYRRFLTEVRQELGQIQKEYNIEILRRQNDAENLALHRSLEWFKQECNKALIRHKAIERSQKETPANRLAQKPARRDACIQARL